MKNNFLMMCCAMVMVIVISSCTTVPTAKKLTKEEIQLQEDIAATLPFEVIIGGQKAQQYTEFCAKLPSPVNNKADIVISELDDDLIVITVTPATKDGLPKAGKKPMILQSTNSNKLSFAKSFSGKKLSPGNYIMNINANNKIATVLFVIK